jgi:hypothetical protein
MLVQTVQASPLSPLDKIKSIININNDEIHLKIICKTIYNIFKVPETGIDSMWGEGDASMENI